MAVPRIELAPGDLDFLLGVSHSAEAWTAKALIQYFETENPELLKIIEVLVNTGKNFMLEHGIELTLRLALCKLVFAINAYDDLVAKRLLEEAKRMNNNNEAKFQIFVHAGAFGPSPWDSALDSMLRRIAIAASSNPEGEWAEKYGTKFENDVFMMHPFCWCEKDDCPWCAGCECPPEAVHYFVDDLEVNYEEWRDFFEREAGKWDGREDTWPEWDRKADAANARRSTRHDLLCDFCKQGGKPAPNFHYKPADFRVWWYKYIGRDVESNRDLNTTELKEIELDCLISLRRQA